MMFAQITQIELTSCFNYRDYITIIMGGIPFQSVSAFEDYHFGY